MNVLSAARKALKTLYLQAGSRYQTKREVKSFWYPTWLAQPAGLVPDPRLLDAPADELTVEQSLDIARGYELKIWEIVREMLSSWDMMKRRLREAVEFFRLLRAHAA